MIGLENIDLDELDFESQCRISHLEEHIPDDFIKRIEALAERVKSNMKQKNYDATNELIVKGVEMIRTGIHDAYSRSILAAFLIEYANYGFSLEGVRIADELFGEGWEILVKEGDSILLNSYIQRGSHIAIYRSLYIEI